MRSYRIRVLMVFFLFSCCMPALAENYDPAAWLGGAYGLSVPNETNTSSRMIYGLSGGAKLGSEYGVGAYYMSSRKDESFNGVTTPWNYDLYGVMAGYFFEGDAKGVYLGAMVGMSKVGTKTPTGADVSTSPFHWGLLAGYDHMLMSHFSLGGELSYISISSSNTTVANQTVNTDGFQTLNFLLTAKAWF